MGCFSWTCSDTKKGLRIGGEVYVPFPLEVGAYDKEAGSVLFEDSYDGYGRFGGYDIYELVAIWNRSFLAAYPQYIIPSENKEISSFGWYKYYSDLSLSENDIYEKVRAENNNSCWEFRSIGIDISCYDCDNAKLPFPIKICKHKDNALYDCLSPSLEDPGQGVF